MHDIQARYTREVSAEEHKQHLKNLHIYGYTQIHGGLGVGVSEQLKEKIDHIYEQTRTIAYQGRPDRDMEDRMIYNLQNKDKIFIDILDEVAVRAILIAMLNDPYYRFLPPEEPNYILGYYNARTSGKTLDLHIDSGIPAPGNRTWCMQVAFVLEDMTEENGCTIVVPGSHLTGEYTDRELQNVKSLHAKAGDILLWDSRLWHGTRENTTKESRWALIATMKMWWMKQSMDITRSLSQGMYEQLTPRQKALLGFCSIPPKDETGRINTKTGYDALLPQVKDYYL